MLGVTNIGSHSHVGSQLLGEVRHRLVEVFLWQLFTRLRLRLGFMAFFQHGAPDVIHVV